RRPRHTDDDNEWVNESELATDMDDMTERHGRGRHGDMTTDDVVFFILISVVISFLLTAVVCGCCIRCAYHLHDSAKKYEIMTMSQVLS
ncbi:MAG: hypothetical protein V2I33_21340, partial [Kangiellaceae bacterium]|nr:hypothetical protein [Kangiellaceae bacterium]